MHCQVIKIVWRPQEVFVEKYFHTSAENFQTRKKAEEQEKISRRKTAINIHLERSMLEIFNKLYYVK
jgi:acetoin utilization deacetylase AcuC-like enzyme